MPDSLSIGDLAACHVYTVLVVSIDEKQNRMKSKRKKIRTEGCSQEELELMRALKQPTATSSTTPNTLWPSGLVGDFKCLVSFF